MRLVLFSPYFTMKKLTLQMAPWELSLQPDAELAVLTVYFIPLLLAFAFFGVMFRNAFYL